MGSGIGWSFSLLAFIRGLALLGKPVVVSRLAVALLIGSLESLPITDLFNESDSGVGLTHLER
jgi:hypothetical protein